MIQIIIIKLYKELKNANIINLKTKTLEYIRHHKSPK